MDTKSNSTSAPENSISAATVGDIIDLIDMLADVRSLNHALSMAAGDSGVTSKSTSALKAVANEIDSRITLIDDKLNELSGGQMQ